MSVISSPNLLKRISSRFPSKINPMNHSASNAGSNNSTSPLPQNNKQNQKKKNEYTVSPEVAMLYDLFSSLVPPRQSCHDMQMPICLCCERKITSKLCLPKQRQHETSHNKQTLALFYGSHQVKKYMKSVMAKCNFHDIIDNGFPCPHTTLKNTSKSIRYYCDECDDIKIQDTIRLTLTPLHCRAQDNEIYVAEISELTLKQAKMKKRRGCIFLR